MIIFIVIGGVTLFLIFCFLSYTKKRKDKLNKERIIWYNAYKKRLQENLDKKE